MCFYFNHKALKMKKSLIGSCVNLSGRLITEMTGRGREIKYNTFIRHIDTSDLVEFGTCPTVKNDYHVRFYSSKYDGKPCVYMVHSAIEYVWVQ